MRVHDSATSTSLGTKRAWGRVQTRVERLNRLGWRIELLDAQQVKELAPIINPDVAGADFDPDAAHANPQRTVQANSWAIQDHCEFTFSGNIHSNRIQDGGGQSNGGGDDGR